MLRGNGLLKEIIEGRIVGKSPRRRKRAMVLDDMKEGKNFMSRWKKEHVTGEIRGLKCLEPAGRQKTNDDDDDENIKYF